MNRTMGTSTKKLAHEGIVGAVDVGGFAIPLDFTLIEEDNAIGRPADGTILVCHHQIGTATTFGSL